MKHIALVTLPDVDTAMRVAEQAHGNTEQAGRVVWLSEDGLRALADLDEHHDGHYDGAHVWVGGSEYRVNPTNDTSEADRLAMAENYVVSYDVPERDGVSDEVPAREQITRTAAHVITADAVALGDPEIIVMTGDDDVHGARVIERHHMWVSMSRWDDVREMLEYWRWRPLGDPTEVETGYLIVDVEAIR